MENEKPGRIKPSLTQARKAAVEALEWHQKKLEDAGDVVAANIARTHTATLKEEAKEAAVAEHRRSFRLVPKDDSEAESV